MSIDYKDYQHHADAIRLRFTGSGKVIQQGTETGPDGAIA